MNQATVSMSHVSFPIAFIKGAIFPLLDSSAVPLVALPLTFINVFALKLKRTQVVSIWDFQFWFIVVERSKFLLFFFDELIGVVGHLIQLAGIVAETLIDSGLVELGGHDGYFFFSFPLLAFL